jgi:hypothetical protein
MVWIGTCEQLALFAVERRERVGADVRAHRGHQADVEHEVVLREQLVVATDDKVIVFAIKP